MAEKIFDRETLLDLSVNAIPLGMLLFFMVLFLVFQPFQGTPVALVLQLAIVLVTFCALLVLTYYAGRAVSKAENEMEAASAPVVDADAETEPEADAALEAGTEQETDAEPAEQ